jgi:hypothetical protein
MIAVVLENFGGKLCNSAGVSLQHSSYVSPHNQCQDDGTILPLLTTKVANL